MIQIFVASHSLFVYSVFKELGMTWTLIALVLSALVLTVTLALRRLMRQGQHAQFDADWLNDFSAAKYRPMMRLLAEDDYEFLALQPGYQAQLAKQLRAERRKIFRAYLRNLTADFERLYRSGQVIVTYSAGDKSELAAALFRQRVHFYWALSLVYARLSIHAFGWTNIEVSNLLRSLEHLRQSLDNVMAGQPIGAPA